jgi:NAD(P)-dependent dehydrogenase (short-subunit alcohol dehydrogenase family)
MTDPSSDPPAGPVVAITGAGRGIGREIALAFADTGARHVLAARTEPELERTRQLVAERSAEAIVALTDVTDAEQTTAMARLTEPGEVAAAAVFLASAAASGITGEDLNVSAGVVNF